MKLNAYLNFDGTCEEAFRFYEKCLNGKIVALHTFEGAPDDFRCAGWEKKIMHVTLVVGDQTLMGSDLAPPYFEKPQGFSVSINFEDTDEAERVFNALSDGATILMPIQETFWAARFGMLKDKFGTPWLVNCEKAA